MADELIPVALDLTQGRFYTVWAPTWYADDEDWEAFLGLDDSIVIFPTIGDLYSFCHSNTQHDLIDHPHWDHFQKLPASSYIPSRAHQFPFVDVMGLAALGAHPDALRLLSDTFEFLQKIAELGELEVSEKFILDSSHSFFLPQLIAYHRVFTASDGQKQLLKVQEYILEKYDAVLDELDEAFTVISADEALVEETNKSLEENYPDYFTLAQTSAVTQVTEANYPVPSLLNASDSSPEKTTPLSEDSTEKEENDSIVSSPVAAETQEPLLSSSINQKYRDSAWYSAGIDPIHIITSAVNVWTLRCYIGEKVMFLGDKNKIIGFESPEELLTFIADTSSSETIASSFRSLTTYSQLVTASQNEELEVIVTPENTYDFTNIHTDILYGPKNINVPRAELACELLTDFAHYAHDKKIPETLDSTAPLGWFLSYASEAYRGKPQKVEPPAPFELEANLWETLEKNLEESISIV